jgi:hypothetical protein
MKFKKKTFDQKCAKFTIGDRDCAVIFPQMKGCPTDEKMEQIEKERI